MIVNNMIIIAKKYLKERQTNPEKNCLPLSKVGIFSINIDCLI